MAAPEEPRTARVRARAAPQKPGTVVLVLSGAITRADIPSLCERARRLLEVTAEERVVCDVEGVRDPDATTVDALSRLQLTARRLGREVQVDRAPRELLRLIDFMGLAGVLPARARSALETRRQAEEREHPGRVQEECDPGDTVA